MSPRVRIAPPSDAQPRSMPVTQTPSPAPSGNAMGHGVSHVSLMSP